MEEEFKRQRENLEVFLTLKKGDKLTKYEEALYSMPSGALQSVKRWLKSETKETTLEYLNYYFKEFMDLLKKMIVAADDKVIDIPFLKIVREYINSIIVGIFSLKETYPSYLELHCKVSSIIRAFIEFKNESLKYVTADYKYHQF